MTEWTYDGYTMDQIKFFLENNLIDKEEARWLFGLEVKLLNFNETRKLKSKL